MNTTRRGFLASLAAAPQLLAQNPRDVRIVDVATSREDYTYRAPLKFGGAIVDRVTLLNVNITISDRAGRTAKGFGSMPMGNIWEIGRASCRERV